MPVRRNGVGRVVAGYGEYHLALVGENRYGVVAVRVAGGAETLLIAGEAARDVIVMDVIMPVMDGIEACREITDRPPETRVLMLSASTENDAVVQSIAAGATSGSTLLD